MFTATEIYSYCRTFKNVQLESYESGARAAASGSSGNVHFKFELNLLKTLLADKIMNACMIDLFGVELEDSKSSDAIIISESSPASFKKGKQIRFPSKYLISLKEKVDLRLLTSEILDLYHIKQNDKKDKLLNLVSPPPANFDLSHTPSAIPVVLPTQLEPPDVNISTVTFDQVPAPDTVTLTGRQISPSDSSSCIGFNRFDPVAHRNITVSQLRNCRFTLIGDTYHADECQGSCASSIQRSRECNIQYHNRKRKFDSLIKQADLASQNPIITSDESSILEVLSNSTLIENVKHQKLAKIAKQILARLDFSVGLGKNQHCILELDQHDGWSVNMPKYFYVCNGRESNKKSAVTKIQSL